MGSVTKEEYAILAAAVYRTSEETRNEKLTTGWRRVYSSPEESSDGLSYAIFHKE